jgi:hypothetical protein
VTDQDNTGLNESAESAAGAVVSAGIPAGFSRESKIHIDREGHFWHNGERIEHRGLSEGFARWIARDDSGRWILRNERDWCFITVEDAPLVVSTARVELEAGQVWLSLTDASTEPLQFATLRLRGEDALYCEVHASAQSPGILARFSRSAAFALLQHATREGDQWVLQLGSLRHVLSVE